MLIFDDNFFDFCLKIVFFIFYTKFIIDFENDLFVVKMNFITKNIILKTIQKILYLKFFLFFNLFNV